MKKSIKKLIAVASASFMALTLAVTAVPNSASAATSKAGKQAAKAEFDPNGEYHAYFGLQQKESWIFRDEWYQKENGLGGTSWKKTEGLDYESGLFRSGQNGLEAIEGATVTDAVIKGNGTYTVGVEGLNGVLSDAESEKQAVMSMIYVSTDIPWSAKGNPVTISDVKLTLDGMDQVLPAEVFYPMEYIEKDCAIIRFDPFNLYQKDKGTYADCPSILTPRDTIQITFTVSGFANDNPDAVEATPEPAPATDDANSSSSSSSDSKSDGGGIGTGAIIAIVVVVVIVIAAIVVVATKKKRD